MIHRYFCIWILIAFLFSLSCNDDPTSSNDIEILKDIDGNTYEIVKIGNQWWMTENLKVIHYRNGEIIPNVTESSAWSNLTAGACCSYNNEVGNIATYGLLYNWYTVNDSRNIAPEGWHVPGDEDFQELINFLGGYLVAGGKMKTTGTIEEGDGLWQLYVNDSPVATNESGFSALPGGNRHNDGQFTSIGRYARFWSSEDSPLYLSLGYLYSYAPPLASANKKYGFSIRCVKDK